MTLYEVISNDDEGTVRLIEAKTRAGARSFAAKEALKVEKCSAMRAHILASRGVKLEKAGKEDQDE